MVASASHKKPAATGSCQPARSTAPAATQGERNGMRQRNTFGAESERITVDPSRTCSFGRHGEAAATVAGC
jgi:hypothetical protein